MQVTLKVIGGKNDGREIKIAVPQFIIGRGEDAHLRPTSDLISRKHCAITIGRGQVTIEDMGSRNGTFVNEEQLPDNTKHVVKIGDILKVGRLQFELLIDHAEAGLKKTKVQSVAEAAQRTATTPAKRDMQDDESITNWIAEPVIDPDQDIDETRQFRLDETTHLFPHHLDADNESDPSETNGELGAELGEQDSKIESDDKDSDSSGIFSRKKKKEKGKLPPRPKFSAESTTSAADDVLKRFFNRR